MKRLSIVVVLIVVAGNVIAQEPVRSGLIFNAKSTSTVTVMNVAGAPVTTPSYQSLFSVGTLVGLNIILSPQQLHTVLNNVVVNDIMQDGLAYGIYALPSLNLIGFPGHSLSLIAPIGVQPSSSSGVTGAGGLGLSYGFNVRSGFEIGLAAVWMLSPIEQLSAVQQQSLTNQTPLPAGVSSKFGTRTQSSFAVGLYFLPTP